MTHNCVANVVGVGIAIHFETYVFVFEVAQHLQLTEYALRGHE